LQITDAGFPTGGFAHSGGLEAAIAHGAIQSVDELESFFAEALWQIGHSALPFVNVTFDDSHKLQECDEFNHAFLSNHVANRASQVQGRTFFTTCQKAFGLDDLKMNPDFHFHYAPVFGFVMKSLSMERELMQRSFLHIALRGMISASVRLGMIGPYQGQQILTRFHSKLEEVIAKCQHYQLDDVAQTAPLIDIYQNNQDQLYSKLFQS
jgi:urease accessory protein